MARPLSPNTALAVKKLFAEGDRAEAESLLAERCADGLPNCQDEDEYSLEDLRFQVLKRSGGDLGKLRQAVAQANVDWRELMAPAAKVKRYKWDVLGGAMVRNPYSDSVQKVQGWNFFASAASFALMLALGFGGASAPQRGVVILVIVIAYAMGTLLIRHKAPFRDEGPAHLILSAVTYVGFPVLLGILAANALRMLP